MMAAHADLVGMTIASECVVAGELGLPYAALCMVDNLANGIGERAARASPSWRPTASANARAPRRRPRRDAAGAGRVSGGAP